MVTSDNYLSQLLALLPRGLLWDSFRQPGTWAWRLCKGLTREPARVEQRANDMAEELDPRTTLEMLDEWELFAGLPDPCAQVDTLQERRAAVTQQLTQPVANNRAAVIALAARLGYTVTIQTYKPFICGISKCGDALNPVPMRYVWRVHVSGSRATRFRCGVSRCGEKLLTIRRADDLECVLQRMARSHTKLFVSYEGV